MAVDDGRGDDYTDVDPHRHGDAHRDGNFNANRNSYADAHRDVNPNINHADTNIYTNDYAHRHAPGWPHFPERRNRRLSAQ